MSRVILFFPLKFKLKSTGFRRVFSILFLLNIFKLQCVLSASIPVTLFIDPTIKNADGIFELAKNDVLQFSPNVTLENVKYISQPCSETSESDTSEVYDFFKKYYSENHRITIGPTCLKNFLRFSNLTAEVQSLQMNVLMGYPNDHPTMIDMVTRSPRNLANNILAVMKGFGWSKIGIVKCEECYKSDILAAENHFYKIKEYLGDSVQIYIDVSKNMTLEVIAEKLEDLKNNARVIFTFMGNDLVDYKDVLLGLQSNNFTKDVYQPVIVLSKYSVSGLTYPWTGSDPSVLELYDGSMLIHNNAYSKALISDFVSKFSFSSDDEALVSMQIYEAYHVLGNYLYSATADPKLFNYVKPEEAISTMNIKGPFGDIHINKEGQRISPFEVLLINSTSSNPNSLYELDTIKVDRTCEDRACLISSRYLDEGPKKVIQKESVPTVLVNENNNNFFPVQDEPECGFNGDKCSQYNIILAIGIIVGVLLIGVCVYFIIVKIKNSTTTRSMTNPWQIPIEEIVFIDLSHTTGSQYMSIQELQRVSEERDHMKSMVRAKKLASVDQSYVVVESFLTKDKWKADKVEAAMLYSMKSSIQHDNVNQFIGISIEKNRISIIWSQCFRGSLHDLILTKKPLERDKSMNNNVQGAFVRDILKGLDYLHSSNLQYHGALTSVNCMIDAHWILKLTGFGINRLLYKMKTAGQLFTEDLRPIIPSSELHYYSPEIRRLMSKCGNAGDKKELINIPPAMGKSADMYSFGVVLFEVTFQQKFVDLPDITTPKECKLISDEAFTSVAFYPEIPEDKGGVHPDLIALLHRCWNGKPKDRPDPSLARKITDAVLKMSGSLVDQMIANLHAYTGGLENLVKAQTADLQKAIERSNNLLSELIPPSIVEEMRDKHRVNAKTFENSTILYSDIVGFTSLCSESQPMEVVNLLSGMYARFDIIIARNNGYKMETIGDAYCVVAGLPIPRETEHVQIIARIALLQRDFLHQFEIPHRPGQYLNCRWGFNSGPVFAGVIGMKAPRYSCFGATVSIAAKMESSGVPDRIQMTLKSQQLLAEHYPEFAYGSRGICKIDGMGTFLTYWLEGFKENGERDWIKEFHTQINEELKKLELKSGAGHTDENQHALARPIMDKVTAAKQKALEEKQKIENNNDDNDSENGIPIKNEKSSILDTPPYSSTEATPIETPILARMDSQLSTIRES